MTRSTHKSTVSVEIHLLIACSTRIASRRSRIRHRYVVSSVVGIGSRARGGLSRRFLLFRRGRLGLVHDGRRGGFKLIVACLQVSNCQYGIGREQHAILLTERGGQPAINSRG